MRGPPRFSWWWIFIVLCLGIWHHAVSYTNFHQEWHKLHFLYAVLRVIRRKVALMVHTDRKKKTHYIVLVWTSVNSPRIRPNIRRILLKSNAQLLTKLIFLLGTVQILPSVIVVTVQQNTWFFFIWSVIINFSNSFETCTESIISALINWFL